MSLRRITAWWEARRQRQAIIAAARAFSTEQVAAALADLLSGGGASRPAARQRLPDCRQGVTELVRYRPATGVDVLVAVTMNLDSAGVVREVFGRIPAFKEGAEMADMLAHACTAASLALQHGAEAAEILHAMGEEDAAAMPGSVLAAVLRRAAGLDWPDMEVTENAA